MTPAIASSGAGTAATAVDLFLFRARELGGRAALRVMGAGGAGDGRVVSWAEWAEESRAFAAALLTAGSPPGTVVAIFAGNRPEWPIADVGTLLAGCVGVGLYPTSAALQVGRILADASAAIVVVDSPGRLALLESVLTAEARGGRRPAGGGSAARRPTVIAPDAVAAGRGGVVAWSEWLERGRRALDGDAAEELERRRSSVTPEDVAVLIYTSGSTGEPKGAGIPHRGLLASAASVRDTLELTADDTTLSFLPFCHAAERIFGLYTRILCGMECGLVEDHTRVGAAALEYGPTLFGGLPRFYEKAYEAIEAERRTAVGTHRARWERALELGRRRSRWRRGSIDGASIIEHRSSSIDHRGADRGTDTGTGTDTDTDSGVEWTQDLEREWAEVVEPFAARLRGHFGGRVRLATSGGAALPVEVAETLDALGLTVLGAYGLTEHLCAAFNRPDRYSFDSAGPPMPGTTLRIADDGEILIRRSELTFAGYHGRPAETRAAFTADAEWLRTGDLGSMDDRGFLRITGRKKELIALSTGKKVAPLPIESALVDDPWIAQAVLHGEGRKFVSALLTLRRPVVEAWARQAGIEEGFRTLAERPEVRARVQEAVDRVNAGLSRTEQVRRFVVLDRELSLEQDELTPTLKVRRAVVIDRFRDRLDALYT